MMDPHMAEAIGRGFVNQYYDKVERAPEDLYRYYHKSWSVVSRPNRHDLMETVTTIEAIHDTLLSWSNERKVEVKSTDIQTAHTGGILILVTGCSGKDNIQKKFVQTFFLAPQDCTGGHFVQNDVLRFVGESKSVEFSCELAPGNRNNATAVVNKIDQSTSECINTRICRKDVTALDTKDNRDPPQLSNSSPERSLLNPTRKLIILDVNGLLADIVLRPCRGYKSDRIISGKHVFKRPSCYNFLQFLLEKFVVGVWSSRVKKNLDEVINFLMAKLKDRLLFCWDQSHCTHTGLKTLDNNEKPLVLKELKKLWEKQEPGLPWEKGQYNESNTLLIDDSPYKALRNPAHTAIFPESYRYDNRFDDSLGPGGDLRVYLEGLAIADNVQEYVKQNPFGQKPITEANPSWEYYCNVAFENGNGS